MRVTHHAFERARAVARRLVASGSRAERVLAAAAFHLQRRPLALRHLGEEVATAVRLVRETLAGRYRQLPRRSLVAVLAGLIYFVNPLDALPDALLGVGLLDDAAVLGWVLAHVKRDLEAFREWERGQDKVVEAEAFVISPPSLRADQ